ncbi:SDR family oxidoreductase [Enterococcus hulanensis]|uniref:SDR family oxidoreductase n=1 Tax=Enterococcus hulanensis TaxID=2559929 RepID=A0ABU3ETP1_9ENTE|nr:SDR family oxidoreductase [Enterococcus hulanensis]MDT2598225.1 SDR family oxidoreductase [Enterococcus hulanensis]MDT2608270.1 SDR family oxidoreductase [Enterococcus hulanensis]MDT2615565.1 SDR family oxidoreductase [Enterococcus hulanensis]MDT2626464.1 SDR family oxidoreductase [Enterococcus hulanensis]MDT2654637.1 SDR family oxidoreductase [Enterococcus hulanensis]
MKYLVTGATGGFGGYALDFLKESVATADIYALVRSEEKGAALKEAGLNIRIGDYADMESMKQALEGIDRLLFVSGAPGNRQEEHANVVEAAKEAGVAYIAYTSFAGADKATSPLAADHIFTERLIEKSGIAHTFLRNNWYLENEMPISGAALSNGKFVYAAENGKTGWALKREYAEVAAKALAGTEYPAILELSGKPVSYDVLAEALKKAIGKDFEVVRSDDQGFIDNLVGSGMPQPVAEMFLSFQYDIKNDQLDVVSDDFEKALGRPLVSLEAGLKELLA